MDVRVKFFARARDLAGCAEVLFRLPEGATVGKFRLDLAHQYPMLEGLLARCAIAVNGDFAGDQTVLLDDCEAAVLPPVSGGSHSNSF